MKYLLAAIALMLFGCSQKALRASSAGLGGFAHGYRASAPVQCQSYQYGDVIETKCR